MDFYTWDQACRIDVNVYNTSVLYADIQCDVYLMLLSTVLIEALWLFYLQELDMLVFSGEKMILCKMYVCVCGFLRATIAIKYYFSGQK